MRPKIRNKIGYFRKKLNMAVRQVADKVDISLDYHLLYESDCHPVPFNLAIQYAEALQTPLGKLFPRAASLLKHHGDFTNSREVFLATSKLAETFREKGLEFPAQKYQLLCEFIDGRLLRRDIASSDVSRLHNWLFESNRIIVVDSLFTRFLLNKVQIAKMDLIWDPSQHIAPPSDEYVLDNSPRDWKLSFWLTNRKEVLEIEFDDLNQAREESDGLGQINTFFQMAELADDFDSYDQAPNCFTDENGELIWINLCKVVFAETPLINVSPSLFDLCESEGDDIYE